MTTTRAAYDDGWDAADEVAYDSRRRNQLLDDAKQSRYRSMEGAAFYSGVMDYFEEKANRPDVRYGSR